MDAMRGSNEETKTMRVSSPLSYCFILKVILCSLLLSAELIRESFTLTLDSDVAKVTYGNPSDATIRTKRTANPLFVGYWRMPKLSLPFLKRRPKTFKLPHHIRGPQTHHNQGNINSFHSTSHYSEEKPWAHKFPTKEEFDFAKPGWFEDGDDVQHIPHSEVHISSGDFGPLKGKYILQTTEHIPEHQGEHPTGYHEQEHPEDLEGYHENFLSGGLPQSFHQHLTFHSNEDKPQEYDSNQSPVKPPGIEVVNFRGSFNPGDPSDGYTLEVPPAHASEVTKHSIYREDYPKKFVSNPNDKIRDDLLPSGIKGIDPLTMSFIKTKVRQYGNQSS